MSYNIDYIRSCFPALRQKVYGRQLVYFDSAATTLKPDVVIEEIKRYYEHENSNVHRGFHYLSRLATEAFEHTREYISEFLNARHAKEIIFTKGATEGINLIANSFGKTFINKNDEIIISGLEHHSNIVPWQMVCEERGALLKIIPVLDDGSLDIKKLDELITKKTKIISVTHISNVLGTIIPIENIIEISHRRNIPVVIDGAQGIVHSRIDVQKLDCDFYCFSGHKLYGPMGSGVIYGKHELLEQMVPYQGGGEMIKDVRFEKTTYNELPFKFEAGTPIVSSVLGLRKAIEFIQTVGIENILQHENNLIEYATEQISRIIDIIIYGTSRPKSAVLSFVVKDIHPSDLGILMDKMGIAVRTGQHCAQPLMDRFNIPGTVRASFAMYNTIQEIDIMIESLKKAIKMLK